MNLFWTCRKEFILLIVGIVLLAGCVEEPEKVVVTITTSTITTTTTTTSTIVTTGIITTITMATATSTTTTTTTTTIIFGSLDDTWGYGVVEGFVIYNNTPQRLVRVMAMCNNSVIKDTYTDKFAKYEIKVPAGYDYDITIDFRNKTFSQKVSVAKGYRYSASFVINE